jgi:hypothetical protein
MNIKKFDISRPTKYLDRSGKESTRWNHIGTLTEFHKPDGQINRIIEIPAIGLEANVFEQKPKADTAKAAQDADEAWDVALPSTPAQAAPVDINPDDIPF